MTNAQLKDKDFLGFEHSILSIWLRTNNAQVAEQRREDSNEWIYSVRTDITVWK